MNRLRTSLLRRVVMWTAGVVLAVSVAAWVASLFNVVLVLNRSGQILGVGQGCAVFRDAGPELPMEPGWYVLDFSWAQRWVPTTLERWGITLPLWIPGVLAAVVFGRAWSEYLCERRRGQSHGCPACGYDLTGITGPCPECGREQELKA